MTEASQNSFTNKYANCNFEKSLKKTKVKDKHLVGENQYKRVLHNSIPETKPVIHKEIKEIQFVNTTRIKPFFKYLLFFHLISISAMFLIKTLHSPEINNGKSKVLSSNEIIESRISTFNNALTMDQRSDTFILGAIQNVAYLMSSEKLYPLIISQFEEHHLVDKIWGKIKADASIPPRPFAKHIIHYLLGLLHDYLTIGGSISIDKSAIAAIYKSFPENEDTYQDIYQLVLTYAVNTNLPKDQLRGLVTQSLQPLLKSEYGPWHSHSSLLFAYLALVNAVSNEDISSLCKYQDYLIDNSKDKMSSGISNAFCYYSAVTPQCPALQRIDIEKIKQTDTCRNVMATINKFNQ